MAVCVDMNNLVTTVSWDNHLTDFHGHASEHTPTSLFSSERICMFPLVSTFTRKLIQNFSTS